MTKMTCFRYIEIGIDYKHYDVGVDGSLSMALTLKAECP